MHDAQMTKSLLALGVVTGLVTAWIVGTETSPCPPGKQRPCDMEHGGSGVQYCRESGFGYEQCQSMEGPEYPQALWRNK
jgi:hypothetical protein